MGKTFTIPMVKNNSKEGRDYKIKFMDHLQGFLYECEHCSFQNLYNGSSPAEWFAEMHYNLEHHDNPLQRMDRLFEKVACEI